MFFVVHFRRHASRGFSIFGIATSFVLLFVVFCRYIIRFLLVLSLVCGNFLSLVCGNFRRRYDDVCASQGLSILLRSVANGWYPSGGLLRLLSTCPMGVLGSMF